MKAKSYFSRFKFRHLVPKSLQTSNTIRDPNKQKYEKKNLQHPVYKTLYYLLET